MSLVLSGLYVAKCWQVRSDALTMSGQTMEEYRAQYEFWLAPAFSGEPHWHLKETSLGVVCLHAWRRGTFRVSLLGSAAELSDEQLELLLYACSFTLDSGMHGGFEWSTN